MITYHYFTSQEYHLAEGDVPWKFHDIGFKINHPDQGKGVGKVKGKDSEDTSVMARFENNGVFFCADDPLKKIYIYSSPVKQLAFCGTLFDAISRFKLERTSKNVDFSLINLLIQSELDTRFNLVEPTTIVVPLTNRDKSRLNFKNVKYFGKLDRSKIAAMPAITQQVYNDIKEVEFEGHPLSKAFSIYNKKKAHHPKVRVLHSPYLTHDEQIEYITQTLPSKMARNLSSGTRGGLSTVAFAKLIKNAKTFEYPDNESMEPLDYFTFKFINSIAEKHKIPQWLYFQIYCHYPIKRYGFWTDMGIEIDDSKFMGVSTDISINTPIVPGVFTIYLAHVLVMRVYGLNCPKPLNMFKSMKILLEKSKLTSRDVTLTLINPTNERNIKQIVMKKGEIIGEIPGGNWNVFIRILYRYDKILTAIHSMYTNTGSVRLKYIGSI